MRQGRRPADVQRLHCTPDPDLSLGIRRVDVAGYAFPKSDLHADYQHDAPKEEDKPQIRFRSSPGLDGRTVGQSLASRRHTRDAALSERHPDLPAWGARLAQKASRGSSHATLRVRARRDKKRFYGLSGSPPAPVFPLVEREVPQAFGVLLASNASRLSMIVWCRKTKTQSMSIRRARR